MIVAEPSGMPAAELFPLLLAVHIVLALALFLPSFLLPFGLRAVRIAGSRPAAVSREGPIVRGLLRLQASGTIYLAAGVGLTGLGLVAILGTQLLAQPWLLTALLLYAANLGLAFFIQRPSLRRLLRLPVGETDAERERWRAIAGRQRYLSYVMAAVVGTIAFLMSAKPEL